jgi:nucleotide-binding universal stress UspA family protein
MYHHILVPLENSPTDEVVLHHIRQLARFTGAKLTLIHVAEGHVARNLEQLNLSPSPEMIADRDYLESRQTELSGEGLTVSAHLACGEPAEEILRLADKIGCDLIAMSTHGHRLLGDLVLGSVAEEVRHRTDIPVLLIRAPKKPVRHHE